MFERSQSNWLGVDAATEPLDHETNPIGTEIPKNVLRILWLAGIQSATVSSLFGLNRRLWSLEDHARSRQTPAEDIVAIKLAIDRANAERHRLIDKLDEEVAYEPSLASTVRYSNTVGELCDRLVILELKTRNALSLSKDESLPLETRARCCREHLGVNRWKAHMETCLVEMLKDMAELRAILPPRREFKAYNDLLLNPITRQETSNSDI